MPLPGALLVRFATTLKPRPTRTPSPQRRRVPVGFCRVLAATAAVFFSAFAQAGLMRELRLAKNLGLLRGGDIVNV